MTGRPKIAIYWLGACGGCDSSLIDLGESLLDLAAETEIIIWPAVLDFKHERLRGIPDGSIALTILSGCLRNSEHLKIAELLRAKSRLLLACGACACFGGIPGLANLRPDGEITAWVYGHSPTVTNPGRVIPWDRSGNEDGTLPAPEFYRHVFSLNQAVAVDYFLPGCPPPPGMILEAVYAVLQGEQPAKGSTLAHRKPLCDSCPRNPTKPLRMVIRSLRCVHEAEVDSARCFLADGILCMGPATRDGCGGSCLIVNAPCRGCFGPVEGVRDAGARFLASLATLLDPPDEEELHRMIESLADPTGYACRFTQAVSILGSRTLPEDDTP
jgi:F420-non-reducing hydrogenase small subunit